MISSQAYVFETPLIEGVVIKRNSQFTMTIEAEVRISAMTTQAFRR